MLSDFLSTVKTGNVAMQKAQAALAPGGLRRLHEQKKQEGREKHLGATAAGAATGAVGGGAAGYLLGSKMMKTVRRAKGRGAAIGAAAGAVGLGTAGALASRLKKKRQAQKLGSAAAAAFMDMADPISLQNTSKTALADDTLHESEEDARKRRLGELLRRRQHSGLDTGSATPNPPRDNT
jgi:hypothetical protein